MGNFLALKECVDLGFQLNFAAGQVLKISVIGTLPEGWRQGCRLSCLNRPAFSKAATDESLNGRQLMVEMNLPRNGRNI